MKEPLTEEICSFFGIVQESGQDELQKLANRIDWNSSYVQNNEEGLERVYKERAIFFTSDFIPSFLIRGNCSFAWIPGSYFPAFGSIGFRKGLPLATPIARQ